LDKAITIQVSHTPTELLKPERDKPAKGWSEADIDCTPLDAFL
jgi:hypothetical protein